MADCTFTCPACEKRSVVQTYGGMSDIYSMNCTQCPTCIHIGVYDPSFTGVFMRHMGNDKRISAELEDMLNPCECGGTFKADAPYRCPNCRAPFSREEVVKHIDRRVGFLVMSKAVEGKGYWKVPKDQLTLTDKVITKARIGQVVVGQWARVVKGLIEKK